MHFEGIGAGLPSFWYKIRDLTEERISQLLYFAVGRLSQTICASTSGLGHAVPDKFRTSAEIEDTFGLSRGWIEQRTGIRKRPVLNEGRAMSDLAVEAGEAALEDAEVSAEDIDLLLLATSTPDHLLPPSSPLVAHRLGLQCGATDITGACTGFLYALVMASSLAETVQQNVLIIAANVLSRRINPADKSTMALFSDGAGAVVMSPSTRREGGLLGQYLGSDGSGYDRIKIPGGGSREPFSVDVAEAGRHLMEMKKGPEVFRKAVNGMVRAGNRALQDAGMSASQVDWWIPHQANLRITKRAGRELGILMGKTVSIIETYGNSSAASIPLAWSIARQDGRIRSDDTLLFTAMGAGMVEAGVVWRF